VIRSAAAKGLYAARSVLVGFLQGRVSRGEFRPLWEFAQWGGRLNWKSVITRSSAWENIPLLFAGGLDLVVSNEDAFRRTAVWFGDDRGPQRFTSHMGRGFGKQRMAWIERRREPPDLFLFRGLCSITFLTANRQLNIVWAAAVGGLSAWVSFRQKRPLSH